MLRCICHLLLLLLLRQQFQMRQRSKHTGACRTLLRALSCCVLLL
jgi:hypothetical protein